MGPSSTFLSRMRAWTRSGPLRVAERGGVVVGAACRPGTEPPSADGQQVQRRGDRMYAAVVDGAGHHAAVVAHAAIAPAVITHTGMVMGGLAGLTTARQMAHAYDVPPHASAVYACMEPGWPPACTGSGTAAPTVGTGLRSPSGPPTRRWAHGCGGTAARPSNWCPPRLRRPRAPGHAWGWHRPASPPAARSRSARRSAWCCSSRTGLGSGGPGDGGGTVPHAPG